jgi:hypothetical protein
MVQNYNAKKNHSSFSKLNVKFRMLLKPGGETVSGRELLTGSGRAGVQLQKFFFFLTFQLHPSLQLLYEHCTHCTVYRETRRAQ